MATKCCDNLEPWNVMKFIGSLWFLCFLFLFCYLLHCFQASKAVRKVTCCFARMWSHMVVFFIAFAMPGCNTPCKNRLQSTPEKLVRTTVGIRSLRRCQRKWRHWCAFGDSCCIVSQKVYQRVTSRNLNLLTFSKAFPLLLGLHLVCYDLLYISVFSIHRPIHAGPPHDESPHQNLIYSPNVILVALKIVISYHTCIFNL